MDTDYPFDANIMNELFIMTDDEQSPNIILQRVSQYVHTGDVYIVCRLISNDYIRRLFCDEQTAQGQLHPLATAQACAFLIPRLSCKHKAVEKHFQFMLGLLTVAAFQQTIYGLVIVNTGTLLVEIQDSQ